MNSTKLLTIFRASPKRTLAIAAAIAVVMVVLLVLWSRAAGNRQSEALQEWVEKQNFVFLVPARSGFLPGDILEWPKPAPGQPPSGDLQLFERSAEVLAGDDGSFQETGPFSVTLSGSIEAALRAGVLTPGVAAEAKAGGGEDFELVMEEIKIVEAPSNVLARAIARNPDLVEALKDPSRTVVSRILRPGKFRYRFFASGSTGFGAKVKRFFGVGDAGVEVGSDAKFKTAMKIESQQPLVIGIAMARLDLPRMSATPNADAQVRSLDFEESRTLQTDPNAALWPAGATLRIRFLDGGDEQKRLFKEAMAEWLKHANLKASYPEAGTGDIRVSFEPVGPTWSYVGTTALRADPDRPTITLGFPVDQQGARRTYLHEIGHVLGLVHEFQNPKAQPLWNRQAVYAHMERITGWPREAIDQMFFKTDSYPGLRALDTRSVMGYPLPAGLLRNGGAFTPGDDLSESDRAYIAQLYPRDS